jgi:cell division transport system ATP-binding protein
LQSQGVGHAYVRFDNVEVRYADYVYGLRGFSLEIAKGEFVFLMGKTGSGKSTALKLLTRETKETAGRVLFAGRDLSTVRDGEVPGLRRQMGIVPQDFGLLPRKRLWENIGYAMRAVGATRREVRMRVPEFLERVGIGHRADAFPHQLSGGEQQRAAIARALINNPPLLLADEPTGNLDAGVSWEIMQLLEQLNLRGTTVIVATHDTLVVERMGRRVVHLEAGQVAADMPAKKMLTTSQPGQPALLPPGDLDREHGTAGASVNGSAHLDEGPGPGEIERPQVAEVQDA